MSKAYNTIEWCSKKVRCGKSMSSSVNRYALILQTDPSRGRATLLDQLEGKVERFIKPTKRALHMVRGALIWCLPHKKRTRTVVEVLEVIRVPFDIAILDILFLHHILEMCSLFALPQNREQNVFDLMQFLYDDHAKLRASSSKKFFLFRILMALGCSPDEIYFQQPDFYWLVAVPIDTLLEHKIDVTIESFIDAWLRDCIKAYPMIDSMKTSHFLRDVRTS